MKTDITVAENGNLQIHIPAVLRCHGGKKMIVSPKEDDEVNTPVLVLLARAYSWQRAIDEGMYQNGSEIAAYFGIDVSCVSRILRLTLLSPSIVHRIIVGDYPESINSSTLRENIPWDWKEQEKVLFGAEK